MEFEAVDFIEYPASPIPNKKSRWTGILDSALIQFGAEIKKYHTIIKFLVKIS
jgi:hypothetical protein